MKALFRFTLIAWLGLFFAADLAAQCTSPTSFGGVAANNSGVIQTLTTCAFGGEFSPYSAVVMGNTYSFTATGGAGNFITVRQTNGTGTLVASGLSPLTGVVSPISGTLAVIVHVNATCTTDGVCHTITANCTSCTPPPPPANDNCSGAIAFPTIPVNGTCATLAGNTNGATQSQVACIGTGADDDVWFSFVASATSIIAELTAISGTTDRVHQIFSGTCGSLVSVKCSDPETSTTTGLTIGATYYVRVHTYGTGTNTLFNLCLKVPPPPPANDECANAITLTVNPNLNCGTVTPGTIASATGTADATCTGTEDDDVWFKFTATATSHKIDLLNVAGSTTDLVHQVLSACGGTNLLCSDPNTSTVSGLTIGSQYILRVYSWTGTTGQTTTFNVCIGTVPPPPANDECASAIPLTVGISCSFSPYTTAGATGSVGPPAPGCASYSGGDVWFSAIVPATGRLVIDSNTGSITDGGMAIYSGNCGVLTLIECDDDDSVNGLMPFIDRSGLTPGSTIYIRFWEFLNDNPGSFSICVWAPAPPCNAPGTPSASSIGTTGALLSWAAAAGALSYDYSFGTAGHVCGTGSVNTASTSASLTSLIPNTTYTFCVRTSTCGGGSASSYVSTTFTTAPLPNDNCAGAQTVTCGTTTNGSTVGAASDAAVGSCSGAGTPGNGVWYKLVGNGAQVTLSLCGSAYDTKVHVYTGTCGTLSCLVSNDDNAVACPSATTRSQVVFNANVGTDYYILVSGFGSSTGAFSMSLTCLCGPALGAPWTVTNIGASNGGAIENVCDGTTDIKATNYGSPTNDVQTYAWQQMCGNGFIKAKLENVTNGGWGGLMFRENSAGGSKKIAIRSQLATTVVRDLRATTNGVMQQQNFPRPNTPQWLRLTRNGNVFLGETSVDGVNWNFTFAVTLVLPNCIQVGLFSQSINVNTTSTAIFSNIMGVPTSTPVNFLVDGSNGNVETQEVLSIFPNPATDEINVKMEAFYGKNVTISMQNQLGQVMLQRDIDDVQDATERIELTNLPSGIYILTLRTAGQAPVSKQFMVGSQRP